MFTITVERIREGYEARFSTCEQDAIAFVCKRHRLDRSNIRIVRVY